MSHWNSYKDDPFFYEQDHNHNEEERVENNMQWPENNAPQNVQMPAAPMENVPMPPVQMPVAAMPIAVYPFPSMCGCPPVTWCCPYPMAEAMPMPSFADDGFDGPDMAPQTMPLGMENAPNPTMGDTDPMSEDPDSVAPMTMLTQGTFAPSPMFPVAGMAPTVPFPMCGPIMPGPTVLYTSSLLRWSGAIQSIFPSSLCSISVNIQKDRYVAAVFF